VHIRTTEAQFVEREKKDWIWRAFRRAVSLSGTAQRADGSTVRVLVSNISYQGCRLWSEGGFEPGEAITLCVSQMSRIKGHVRWISGDSVGLKFLTGDSAVDDRRARIGV
jgi:hypothetical protein